MKKKILMIVPALFLFLAAFSSQANDKDYFARYPSLSHDGSKIAFVYQGDIWVKDLDDSSAPSRLTIHEGYERMPRWSPDDQNIAFTSNRYGHSDVYVIDQDGNNTRRLTYHSTSDVISDWYSGEEIMFTTNRAFAQVEREDEVYRVSLDGETPHRMMDAVGYQPVRSPNKRFIAFVRGSCREEREDYKGPANKDIWVYDTETEDYHQITEYEGNDFQPRWAGNNTLYFISSRPGKYNIFSMNLDKGQKAGEAVAKTQAQDFGIRYFDVSPDGETLVYEKGIDIFLKKKNDRPAEKLALKMTRDYRFTPVQHKTYSGDLSDYALSPSGAYTTFVIRGEIFLVDNQKKKSRTVRLTKHPYRDFDIDFVNDSTLIFVSDRSGQRELYLLRSADPDKPGLYESLRHQAVRITQNDEPEYNPVASPDGKKVAFARGNGTFVVANIDTEKGRLSDEKVLREEGWATPSGVTWSPDGQWLAYSMDDLNFNSEIFIHPVDNSHKPVNVSMHPKGDHRPFWSPDGSKLGFISERNNGDRDLWFAWLNIEDWQKTREDWEEMDEQQEKDDEDKDKPVDITIDLENIHDRLEQVTSLPGNEGELAISKDGNTFYFVTNRGGRRDYDADSDLYSVKWNGEEMKRLTQNDQSPRGVTIDHKNNTLYMLKQGGRLAKLNTQDEALKSVSVKAEMDVHLKEEMEQLFEDGWMIMKEKFYDPQFHGNDWNKLKKKYKPLALAASTKHDFRDMFNIMLGQLNASHMGMYGSDLAETENERTGLLGVEVTPHKRGVEITHVIPNSPADKEFSKLRQGEVITLVNGNEIANHNLYASLINKADEEVYMEVMDQDGNTREVIIRPTSSLRQEKYQEWVDKRKSLTDQYSGGKLGYIHIQGMNWPSFERFERELMASGYGKKGIVIDVRYNGGGWTTDYLMSVLNVRQHAYTIPRGATDNLDKNHQNFREYYPFSERLPLSSWTKPSITLCNQNSYSNAEIFSHAYKTLDHGKLVGIPTFGAVISTGGRRLIDDSYIRMPYRAWYVKKTGENMEHGPAVPDIIINNRPDSKAEGRDEQLKRAVEELLEQIDKN